MKYFGRFCIPLLEMNEIFWQLLMLFCLSLLLCELNDFFWQLLMLFRLTLLLCELIVQLKHTSNCD